jgi:hypothetical protein
MLHCGVKVWAEGFGLRRELSAVGAWYHNYSVLGWMCRFHLSLPYSSTSAVVATFHFLLPQLGHTIFNELRVYHLAKARSNKRGMKRKGRDSMRKRTMRLMPSNTRTIETRMRRLVPDRPL